jgi:hypothetical protein
VFARNEIKQNERGYEDNPQPAKWLAAIKATGSAGGLFRKGGNLKMSTRGGFYAACLR